MASKKKNRRATICVTHCCTLQASHIRSALRRLRPDLSLIRLANSGGRRRPSFLHTDVRT